MASASAPPQMSRQQFESLIVSRAWKDDDFRKEFVADPKGTLEKYSEQKMPDNVKIIVHEEDDTTMHLTIPQKPANLGELSDEDLAKVAGGVDVAITIAVASLVVAIVALGTPIAQSQTERRHGW